MSEHLLELKNISKSFGTNQVLFGVNFTLDHGEIHAIIGENGAGKSTMMNIIDGLFAPDSGEIYLEGEQAKISSPIDAQKLGIGFVHQEIALCQDVSVAQNIFMSQVPMDVGKRAFMNYKKQALEARTILNQLDSGTIEPTALVMNLSISSQQIVEIAKALSRKCRVLILDEPTAALSETETNALYKIMRQLSSQGIGIIYISHRMSEIFENCDTVSVLRDGSMISKYKVKEVTSVQQLVNDMAGREVTMLYPDKRQTPRTEKDHVLLDVRDLSDENGRFSNINFKLHKGEILGFSGLIGSGRSEVMQGITGLRRLKSGRVEFLGKDITGLKPGKVFSRGLLYMSEDRKQTGLFLDMSISPNISAVHRDLIVKNGMIQAGLEKKLARKMVGDLNVKAYGIDQFVMDLSGGNQQKIFLGKLLAKKPAVVILDEPTRGIDVASKAEIHRLLRSLVAEEIGVIIVSSELNEILGMCDRVAVMNEGSLVGEVEGEDINTTSIMYFASGAFRIDSKQTSNGASNE
ncbi:MAG: sugar ABC transporter ATP-binding protein [Treponema sp.]|nr:sugar ABC transporter ATP-binding protein [Treponema sp.]